jgi:hypothetical protein
MTSIQTLHDVLFALVVMIGIAGAMTIALMAASAVFKHDQARATQATGPVTTPAQHQTQSDQPRELVRR